jgi:cytochrome c
MSRLLTAAAYALHNMPLGTRFDVPVLTDEQAYDVAGYIVSHDRPKKENLDEDSDPSPKADRHAIRPLRRWLFRAAAYNRAIRSYPGQGEGIG